MNFYIKKDDDSYEAVTDEKLDSIVGERVKRAKDKVREELEKTYRDELTPKIEGELKAKLESELSEKLKTEYQSQLDEANNKVKQYDVQLRQKTIAAEYGFKPGTEKYLGEGSEDDMRKEADNIKQNFGSSAPSTDKKTDTGDSTTQKRTGVKVTI